MIALAALFARVEGIALGAGTGPVDDDRRAELADLAALADYAAQGYADAARALRDDALTLANLRGAGAAADSLAAAREVDAHADAADALAALARRVIDGPSADDVPASARHIDGPQED